MPKLRYIAIAAAARPCELEGGVDARSLSQQHLGMRAEGPHRSGGKERAVDEPPSEPGQGRASDGGIQKDESARGGAGARARRQYDRRIQRDLCLSGRRISEPAAQSDKSGGTRDDASVVQIAGR